MQVYVKVKSTGADTELYRKINKLFSTFKIFVLFFYLHKDLLPQWEQERDTFALIIAKKL